MTWHIPVDEFRQLAQFMFNQRRIYQQKVVQNDGPFATLNPEKPQGHFNISIGRIKFCFEAVDFLALVQVIENALKIIAKGDYTFYEQAANYNLLLGKIPISTAVSKDILN